MAATGLDICKPMAACPLLSTQLEIVPFCTSSFACAGSILCSVPECKQIFRERISGPCRAQLISSPVGKRSQGVQGSPLARVGVPPTNHQLNGFDIVTSRPKQIIL